RADPFAAPARSDSWKVLARCRPHLLKLIQDVCPRLLKKRAPLLSKLDRVDQRYGSRVVWHFTYHFERRIFTAPRLKIEAQCLGQRDYRDTKIFFAGV